MAGRRARRIALTAFAASMIVGCLHWPDAPYTDAVDSPAPRVADELEAGYPGASVIGRVYRTHMEGRSGRYRIVRRRFLFQDSQGRTHRGAVDSTGRLSASAAQVLDALPEDLHARFFEHEPGPGHIVGRPWLFTDPVTKADVYEFEYRVGERRGFGSIDASGRLREARHFEHAAR